MKRKILFIFHQRNLIGGASKSLLSILEYLKREKEYEIIVLVPGEGEVTEELKRKNIKYVQSSYFNSMVVKNYKGFIKKIQAIIFNKILFKKIYNIVKELEIDLIYTNTSVIDVGYYLSEKLNKKHIIHIREFGEEDHCLKHIKSIKTREKWYNNYNNIFIVISKELKKKYSSIVSEERLKLIYNGIEDNFFEKRYIKDENKKIRLVLIGSVQKGKNQLEILRAAKKLKEKKIFNFKIDFIGEGNLIYKKELEDYIKKNQLELNVEFLGNKNSEEIRQLLKSYDIGLTLSLKEAFGRVTIEYMLAGLPVIATDTGANPELIENGKSGYLYKLGDINQLVEKIELFINNTIKLKEMGVIAREVAMNKYTAQINYEKIKKEIDQQFQ